MKNFAIAAVLFTLALGNVESAEKKVRSGPLADYVARPDDSYRWVKRQETKFGKGSYVELTLTSQTWHDIVWKHQLFILRPSSTKADTSHAMLFIAGGLWKDKYEDKPTGHKLPRNAAVFATLAEHLKTPIAVLLHVPQQPILGGRREDAIIALTFEKFLRTGRSDWPLLLPMTKSAVRAMDAVQEFSAKEWSLDIKTFTVAGASKRGWTTWLTGAVDPRATQIAPIVIDMLNMAPQMKHQLDAWGSYSDQIHDYTERGLQKYLSSPGGKKLRDIVDPFSYREVLTQPKLIMLGTNDAYWPLDALNLYWKDLKGDKYILYVPNNGHGLNDFPRILGTLNALHQSAASGVKMPRLSWDLGRHGDALELDVRSDIKPRKVKAWVATSASRDFRSSRWSSFPTTSNGKGYHYKLPVPKVGYAAMYGEAVYPGEGLPFYLSTNVQIVGTKQAGGR